MLLALTPYATLRLAWHYTPGAALHYLAGPPAAEPVPVRPTVCRRPGPRHLAACHRPRGPGRENPRTQLRSGRGHHHESRRAAERHLRHRM